MTTYHIEGLIRRQENHRGIPRLLVEAFDHDLFYDQKLGAAITDTEGNFRITFQTRDFRRLFDRHPDIYLKIWNQKGVLIHSTRSQLRANAGVEESFLIELPDRTERGKNKRITIGGMLVDEELFTSITSEEVVALAAAYYGDELDIKTRERFESLNPILLAPLRRRPRSLDTCPSLTPYLTFVEAALRRLQAPADLADRFDRRRFFCPAGFEVHETPHFRIHYLRWQQPLEFWKPASGAVLPADKPALEVRRFNAEREIIGATVAGNGVPNYIQQTAIWLEYVFGRFVRDFGFPDPRPARKKLKVLIRYLPGANGAAGRSFIELSNDLNAGALAGAVIHQLFHCVQATCLTGTGNAPFEDWAPFLLEGLPQLMEDLINSALKRWIPDANAFLGQGEEPLSLPGQYRESIIFWKYVAEQYTSSLSASGRRARGADVVGKVLQSIRLTGRADMRTLQLLWKEDSGPYRLPRYGLLCCFQYSQPQEQDIATRETAFGNWLVANFLQYFNRQHQTDRRFTYADAPHQAPGGATLAAPAGIADYQLPPDGSLTIEEELPPWAARYFLIRPGAGATLVTMERSTLEKPVVHLLQLAGNDQQFILRDMNRFDGPFAKSVNTNNLDALLVIVGSTNDGGHFKIRAEATKAVPDVMITHWNCRRGQEYECDPVNGGWHWLSPDLWIDNEHNGQAAGAIRPGTVNRLWVRLRNKGAADATGIKVRFFWQEASPNPQDNGWQTIQTGPEGPEAVLNDLTLRAGEENCWAVDWYIPPYPENECRGYSLRATVHSPLDLNTDNKTALSNYVVINDSDDFESGATIGFRSWWPQLEPGSSGANHEFLETWVIPANNPELLLRLRDLRNLQRISLKDILSRMPVAMAAGKTSSEMPALMIDSHLRFAPPNRLGLPANPFLEIAAADAAPLFTDPGNRSIDPETTPPGLAAKPLLTIVQAHKGLVLGGLTIVLNRKM